MNNDYKECYFAKDNLQTLLETKYYERIVILDSVNPILILLTEKC